MSVFSKLVCGHLGQLYRLRWCFTLPCPATEIPFSASWSVEREVCLFQSHSTPGGVSLDSNLCEGKKAILEPPWSYQREVFALGIWYSKRYYPPESQCLNQTENCDRLFISALNCCGVLVTVNVMEKTGLKQSVCSRNSRKGVWKVLHFPMSPSQYFIVFRCLLFRTDVTGTRLEFQSFSEFPVFQGNS